jgi:hypothetical protein
MNQIVWFLLQGPYKKSKKFAKDKGLAGWEDVVVWRDFRPPHILKGI